MAPIQGCHAQARACAPTHPPTHPLALSLARHASAQATASAHAHMYVRAACAASPPPWAQDCTLKSGCHARALAVCRLPRPTPTPHAGAWLCPSRVCTRHVRGGRLAASFPPNNPFPPNPAGRAAAGGAWLLQHVHGQGCVCGCVGGLQGARSIRVLHALQAGGCGRARTTPLPRPLVRLRRCAGKIE